MFFIQGDPPRFSGADLLSPSCADPCSGKAEPHTKATPTAWVTQVEALSVGLSCSLITTITVQAE